MPAHSLEGRIGVELITQRNHQRLVQKGWAAQASERVGFCLSLRANLFFVNYLSSFCFALVRGGEDVEFRRVRRQRALVDVHPPQVDVNSTRTPAKTIKAHTLSQVVWLFSLFFSISAK